MTRWFAAFCLCLLCSFAVNAADLPKAREMLKNYGLANCIDSQFKEPSAIKEDISLAIGAYSFMGKGMHMIVQNEDTQEVLHDPYAATEKFILDAYQKTSALSKHSDQKMVFYGCLDVYNSQAFDAFVRTQDQYVPQ
ncbi:hypothetical protein [Pseudomonas chlororaphis]|uniref:hypothetical protein n=1 Tax=Pseudomonas chlororaphis TaxID=587753 RepID=UPI000F575347|nr:hypothetical protein [Pseudomonas chlororaphis]AZC95290.1 hypothetical protein C4K28_2562 [Pseudomonas chlororaphis subsp. piscium]MBP5077927.1 hypothetical protein [Pseudomonas chlororaphis]QTT89425.1 hypothetical protein HUT28_19250 [Pseudomonas chlororaphis]